METSSHSSSPSLTPLSLSDLCEDELSLSCFASAVFWPLRDSVFPPLLYSVGSVSGVHLWRVLSVRTAPPGAPLPYALHPLSPRRGQPPPLLLLQPLPPDPGKAPPTPPGCCHGNPNFSVTSGQSHCYLVIFSSISKEFIFPFTYNEAVLHTWVHLTARCFMVFLLWCHGGTECSHQKCVAGRCGSWQQQTGAERHNRASADCKRIVWDVSVDFNLVSVHHGVGLRTWLA